MNLINGFGWASPGFGSDSPTGSGQARGLLHFSGIGASRILFGLANRIRSRKGATLKATLNHHLLDGGQGRHGIINIGLKPPPKGWLVINTNGCLSRITRLAGIGRVLRDKNDTWVDGCSMHAGECSIEGAELWALLHDLELAWENGARRLRVQLDSIKAVQWVKEGGEESPNANLIEACKDMV